MKLGGVEVWCLNEEGRLGVANAREPGFILGNKDIAVVGFSIRRARDECNWERSRSGDGNVWCELFTIRNLWRRWTNRLGTCQIELPIRGLKACLIGFW